MKRSSAAANLRILRDVLIGACIAGVVAALVLHAYPGFWNAPPLAAREIALQHRQTLQLAVAQEAARADLVAEARPGGPSAPCDLQALIPASSAQDGRAPIEHPFPGGPRARAKVFLRHAEAAAARGWQRDAERGLLAACREHYKASAAPTVPLARVLAMLGDRYAAAVAREDSPVLRDQLMARARQVLTLSAQAYATALGPNATRSRQALQRLAMLEEEPVAAGAMPRTNGTFHDGPAPASLQVEPGTRSGAQAKTAAAPPAGTRSQMANQPREEVMQPKGREATGGTSTPGADSEVGQLAADLDRLRAQAAAVSDDPAGFRQRAEVARQERDRCGDAACLREWYGKRRRELLLEF